MGASPGGRQSSYPQTGGLTVTRPPGRVMPRSPSPCERNTRYPGGLDAGERRTEGARESTSRWLVLWTGVGTGWGRGGVSLWISTGHRGDIPLEYPGGSVLTCANTIPRVWMKKSLAVVRFTVGG